MKVTVYVTPKPSVLDPQGAAVAHAMTTLGFEGAGDVRVGKTIEFEVDGGDSEEFHEILDGLCHKLFANPVIEDYRYEIH
ncbi:MAG: phosphoribosylformylglycinamidine synthase subunit PurS [Opitutales bacterium]